MAPTNVYTHNTPPLLASEARPCSIEILSSPPAEDQENIESIKNWALIRDVLIADTHKVRHENSPHWKVWVRNTVCTSPMSYWSNYRGPLVWMGIVPEVKLICCMGQNCSNIKSSRQLGHKGLYGHNVGSRSMEIITSFQNGKSVNLKWPLVLALLTSLFFGAGVVRTHLACSISNRKTHQGVGLKHVTSDLIPSTTSIALFDKLTAQSRRKCSERRVTVRHHMGNSSVPSVAIIRVSVDQASIWIGCWSDS